MNIEGSPSSKDWLPLIKEELVVPSGWTSKTQSDVAALLHITELLAPFSIFYANILFKQTSCKNFPTNP